MKFKIWTSSRPTQFVFFMLVSFVNFDWGTVVIRLWIGYKERFRHCTAVIFCLMFYFVGSYVDFKPLKSSKDRPMSIYSIVINNEMAEGEACS